MRAREGVEERRAFDVGSSDAAAETLFGGTRGALVRDRMVQKAGKTNVFLSSTIVEAKSRISFFCPGRHNSHQVR